MSIDTNAESGKYICVLFLYWPYAATAVAANTRNSEPILTVNTINRANNIMCMCVLESFAQKQNHMLSAMTYE